MCNDGFESTMNVLPAPGSYEECIKGHEMDFLSMHENGKYSYAYNVLRDLTGMNAKKNPEIGNLAENV